MRVPTGFDNLIKVESTGCWTFTRANYRQYGNYEGQSAHRYSYELHKGEIPKGRWVLHTCNNKMCVNPDHLYLGDIKANARDLILSGYRKHELSNDEVNEIRCLLHQKMPQWLIGILFNVTQPTISCIKTGRIRAKQRRQRKLGVKPKIRKQRGRKSTLTDTNIFSIREAIKIGVPRWLIAQGYNVSITTIQRIGTRYSRRHVA